MKNIILLSISGLIILAACSSQNPNLNEEGALSNQEDTIPEFSEPGLSINESDALVIETAMNNQDSSFCDSIENDDVKTFCKGIVDDRKFFEEAIETMNIDLCNKIGNENDRQTCETQIKLKDEVERRNQEYEAELKKNISINEDILASDDITRCSQELTMENYIQACEVNIAIGRYVKNNDESACDDIPTQENRKICQDSIAQIQEGITPGQI
jgi:hypothetical protein